MKALKKELQEYRTHQSKINCLFQWKNKDKDGRSLHTGEKQKFLHCDTLCQICEENNWTKDLVETKLCNQLFAEMKLQEESSTATKKTTNVMKNLEKKVAAARQHYLQNMRVTSKIMNKM
mmetsp:Transcript_14121/g.20165  ORF Transcript_14121/g.20165 Transcript_14121/m.20165 type:complete len:120 (+) Transcript_14121:227-586(+)|eukprot:CAMPEP_0184856756 /NCGR_PEP_ID=MMETSP0580-20130426/1933_1 /TAXON_ID=1118495 /ORGANISM="Dactyliosolen fragilissimus" /LENGTH=119 /DNA_ID=CAMNT_0027351957 /DNA_START=213 /DNA_END=572 /DNA_ORIENTATION=+